MVQLLPEWERVPCPMRVVGKHHINAFLLGASKHQSLDLTTWQSVASGATWYSAADITRAYPAAVSIGSLDWRFPFTSGVTVDALVHFATHTIQVTRVF